MAGMLAGNDRVAAVVAITDIYEAAKGPALVIVDAAPGSGRTYVLQQVYRAFADREQSSIAEFERAPGWNDEQHRYWPASLSGTQVAPTLVVPGAESQLRRLWLGVSGADPTLGALTQLAAQFEGHAVALQGVLAQRTKALPRLGYWAAQVGSLGLTMAGFQLGQGPGALLAVASLGLAVDSAVRSSLPGFQGGSIQAAQKVNAGWEVTVKPSQREDLRVCVATLAEGLELVSAEIPILLVIDDAETLDDQTSALVRRLMAGKGRVTVVVAVDLDAVGGDWGEWLRDQRTHAAHTTVLALGTLPAEDMAALAVELLPGAPEKGLPGLASLVAAAAGQPAVLADLLEVPDVRDALVAGGSLPDDVAGWSRDETDRVRFGHLDVGVQDTLGVVAVLGGAAETTWLAALGVSEEDLADAQATGRLRRVSGLVWFASGRGQRTAQKAYEYRHGVVRVDALVDRYREVIAQARKRAEGWAGAAPEAREAALGTVLRGVAAETVDPNWLAELLELRRERGSISETTDQVLTAAQVRARTASVGRARLVRASADVMLWLGCRELALQSLNDELERVTAKHGPGSGARIPALYDLAYLHAATGHDLLGQPEAHRHLTAAVDYFREILQLRSDRLRTMNASGDPGAASLQARTTETRWQLAETLLDLNQYRGPGGAIDEGHRVIAELIQAGRHNQRSTLARRETVANWTGESGNPTQAIDDLARLLIDHKSILGSDHPDTLATRNNIAHWRGIAGDPAGAATAFEELLTEMLRILGPDHPETLTVRSNIASYRGQAGDVAEAVTAFEELLTDRLRILGPDHPKTLTTRHDLAYWRGEAGDPVGAATAYEELLTDRLRILGPDHPDTLTTRGSLAYRRGEAGDPVGAATAYEELLTEMLRILGPDHPKTLNARSNLARCRGKAGDPVGAATAYEELLTEMLRILGPDHPKTLDARGNLAYWRGKAGDPVGAATAFEELLADRLRILGPDHPATLTTRGNLARCRGEAGDPVGAATAFEDILTDQLGILGPDHPNTLTTRHNLAHWREQAGPG